MKHFCQIYVYDECENFCYLYPTKITSKVQLHTVYTEYTDKSTTPASGWNNFWSNILILYETMFLCTRNSFNFDVIIEWNFS